MVVGRIFGFLCLLVAGAIAFSELMMVMSTDQYEKIILADLVILVWGYNMLEAYSISQLPLWMVFGAIGLVLVYLFAEEKKPAYYRTNLINLL